MEFESHAIQHTLIILGSTLYKKIPLNRLAAVETIPFLPVFLVGLVFLMELYP